MFLSSPFPGLPLEREIGQDGTGQLRHALIPERQHSRSLLGASLRLAPSGLAPKFAPGDLFAFIRGSFPPVPKVRRPIAAVVAEDEEVGIEQGFLLVVA